MNNKIYFFRHGKTFVDNSTPIADWVLTEDGAKKAKEVSDSDVFDDVDIIYSSKEIKAIQTAQPVAEKLNKEILQVKELGELFRPNGHSIGLDRYNEIKEKLYADFDYSEDGWETINHALERFSKAVKQIDEKHEGKNILIVAHGTVMTIFFAKLQGKLNDMYSRWKGLGFCDWGVVENEVVTKDIV